MMVNGAQVFYQRCVNVNDYIFGLLESYKVTIKVIKLQTHLTEWLNKQEIFVFAYMFSFVSRVYFTQWGALLHRAYKL